MQVVDVHAEDVLLVSVHPEFTLLHSLLDISNLDEDADYRYLLSLLGSEQGLDQLLVVQLENGDDESNVLDARVKGFLFLSRQLFSPLH